MLIAGVEADHPLEVKKNKKEITNGTHDNIILFFIETSFDCIMKRNKRCALRAKRQGRLTPPLSL
jgi:hypothetical protein